MATRTSRTPTSRATTSARWSTCVAQLPWVKKDRPGDPRLGAIGGSYGGGYQFLGAFEELRLHGRPIFDALAPEITWHDLDRRASRPAASSVRSGRWP